MINFIIASDYDFNFDEIELKSYEYSGYLKAEHKNQQTKDNKTLDSSFGEAQVSFKYFKDDYSLNSQFQANHSNINNIEENTYTTNQLFMNYKASSNDSFNLGKQSLKWGKGYFFNPIAFLDRKKDPNNPEAAKEGYIFANYKYNKSYDEDLKNFSFDVLFDLDSHLSSTMALKSYFLYLDTDIDIVYLYNDKFKDKVGFDFSKNIETNFEIHGEFAKELKGYFSSLIGIKYLIANDLTITSEYFYQSQQLNMTDPFYDNKYFINKFLQKEPFGIVYSSVYYKNSLNVKDNSYQNSLGTIYNFRNNVAVDISYNKNIGNEKSEFGNKLISDTIWMKVSWYF